MRETNPSKQSKFTDQNQIVRTNPKSSNTKLKSSSSWGSHIVKGFSLEKKAKQQNDTNTATTKKLPLSRSNHKNPFLPYHSRVKRSLLGEFPCSAGTNAAQVYPQYSFDSSSYRTKLSSASSRDLFLELDHLRGLLRDSKEREIGLRAELLEYKTTNPKVLDLGSELELKRNETDALVQRVGLLEAEKTSISEQLSALSSIIERQEESSHTNLEMEIVELRRLNKELQLQKRNLACRLSAAESQLAALEKISQSEIVAKVEAEASLLRHKNENLCKQVEGLQMSRFTEVEELVYLRWVNSCLRNELRNLGSTIDQDNDKGSSPNSILSLDFSGGKKLNLMKKLNKWPKIEEDLDLLPNLECPHGLLDKEERRSPSRRHSISGTKYCAEELVPSKRRQSDGFICSKGVENEGDTTLVAAQNPQCFANRQETNKINMASLDIEKRALRIPNPPPRPSSGLVSSVHKEDGLLSIPPPPPPPPPPLPPLKFSIKSSTSTVQRAPQVVEFYHSLMKRDSRKDSSAGGICDNPNVANVRSSMIDEIENRSSHLLAIKADVETQGEFVNSLIREVNDAEYQDIEDVVAFVKWLDDELCFLVDERAVLKHFDWPEKKADTLREAAFEYRDLKKLESEVSYYEDDPRLPCDTALKKMVALSEKMERSVYNLLKKRDMLMRHSKEFQIPIDWMLDTGIISKIKFGSVKLAKKYMKRVAMELQFKKASEKDPALEYMLLQGVRFAFRIHQFAGGFDAETMHAFEELRNLAYVRHKK